MAKRSNVTDADRKAAERALAEAFRTELGISNLHTHGRRHYLATAQVVLERGERMARTGAFPTILDGIIDELEQLRGDFACLAVRLRMNAREARRSAAS
jgi:hypothetical protein